MSTSPSNDTFGVDISSTKPNLTVSSVDHELDQQIQLANSFFMVTISILSVFGVGGNALVLLCLVKERKLRTMANYLIAHLAFVNFIYSAFVLPSTAYLYRQRSDFACASQAIFGIVFFMMSLHSQLVISCNRYMLVTKPIEVYKKWFTFKKMAALLAFFWCVDITVYFIAPGILVGWRMTYLKVHAICLFFTLDYSFSTAMSPLTWSSFFVSLCFYVALIVYIRKNSVTIGRNGRRDIKASIALFVVMVLYLVTYNILPNLMTVVNNNPNVSRLTKQWVNGMTKILQWLSFCISPAIFGLNIRGFRTTCRKMVCPFIKVHPSDENSFMNSKTGATTGMPSSRIFHTSVAVQP